MITSSSQNPASFWGGKIKKYQHRNSHKWFEYQLQQTQALGWAQGYWGPWRLLGICLPSSWSWVGAQWWWGKGEMCLGNPRNSTLVLLHGLQCSRKLRFNAWHLSGKSFLFGDSKLCFMDGRSAFSSSVGRSKALKHQTCSQTKAGKVNWEYKKSGKCEASPWKSHSYLFLLP